VRVPFEFNPNWKIESLAITVGAAGDIDGDKGYLRDWFAYDAAATEKVYYYVIPSDRAAVKRRVDAGKHHDERSWGADRPDHAQFLSLGSCGGLTDSAMALHESEGRGEEDDQLFTPWGGGQCTLDCQEAYFEKCTQQNYDDWHSTSGNFGLAQNNFSVTMMWGEAVQIGACASGFASKITASVKYTCDEPPCEALDFFDDPWVRSNTTGLDCEYTSGSYSWMELWVFLTSFFGLFCIACCCAACACCGCVGMTCTKKTEGENLMECGNGAKSKTCGGLC